MKGVSKPVIETLIKHHTPGVTPKIWKLNPTSFKLYYLIINACASDPNGVCSASNAELSSIVGESLRSIGYHLKQLEMLELIKIRRVNQYWRSIHCYEAERLKRILERQKGPKEPDWMDEYLDDLAKMDESESALQKVT